MNPRVRERGSDHVPLAQRGDLGVVVSEFAEAEGSGVEQSGTAWTVAEFAGCPRSLLRFTGGHRHSVC